MGKVPILILWLKKATLALATMAASREGKSSSVPSEEALATIDDILSMSKGMRFYGNKTRTYRNPRDSLSGSFFTIPVRYNFKDKDTKMHAEMALRSTCKVNCTTPYPTILRECIKQVIDHVKADYPDNFVRVTVDPGKFALKVARKLSARADESGTADWKVYDSLIPLPKEALDISARSVPEGFRMSSFPISPTIRMD